MSGGGRDLCRSLLRSANIAEHYKKLRTNMKSLILYALRAYRWAISPLIGPACRYVPTCSEYAVEAVERYGAVGGGMRAAWRLLRCHPLALGGFDPVTREESRGTKVSVATGAKS